MEMASDLSISKSRNWRAPTVSSIGDAVVTTDVHGRVTFLNPAAQTLTGRTHEQAVGQDLEDTVRIVNEATRAEVENPVLLALSERATVGLANHTVLISQDGAEWHIEGSATPICTEKGEAAGVVLVFRDINSRKQAEEQQRQSEECFHTLVDNISQLAWMADAKGWIYWYNQRWFNYTGTTLEEMQGWGWKLVHHPDHVERVVERIQRSWDTGEPWEDTFPLRGKDGQYRWFLSRALPIRDASGGIVRWFGTNTDITELREAQGRLAESESRFRTIANTAPSMLWVTAPDGRLEFISRNWHEFSGQSEAETFGKDGFGWLNAVHPDDAEQARRMFLQANQTREPFDLEYRFRRADGEYRWVVDSGRPRCDDAGQFLGYVGSVTDVHEHKQTEQALETARGAAEAANVAKDQFLSMLSHELRNPLAPIRAALHLLKLEERGSENLIQRQACEVIERQVANLTKLISDLLEVSRVVSGRIRLDQQITDRNQVIRNAVETVMPLIDQHEHTLTLHLNQEPLWANIDPTRMEEVLVNLLTNAAKYTPTGGRIDVWSEVPFGASYSLIHIRDNGMGIDPQLLPRIFDLFTQADYSLDRAAGGLGIGLSIAQRLVVLHGGSIEVHSPPDGQSRGSEFVVRLPLLPTPEQPTPQMPVAEQHNAAGVRVLLIDDNHDLVMVLGRTLRYLGYSVQNAYTGPDGLAAADKWRPDIVIMDIGLPGLDGYEVARCLRNDLPLGNGGKKMRLIALTGYGQLTDIALAHEAGFDAHLTKPYELDDLEKLLWRSEPT